MLQTLTCLAFALSLLACKVEIKTPAEKPLDGEAIPDASLSVVDSEATITDLSYLSETHSLIATLSYSGCARATHKLVFGVCAESYPAQCGVKLVHEKTFDTSCRKLVSETFVHALELDFDAAYVTIRNKNQIGKTVLVDKTGKVQSEVSPLEPAPPSEADTLPSNASIQSLTYDKASDALMMTLEYSGCTDAKHSLTFSDVCATSFPMQCSATLVREKDFDPSCKKLIREEFSFPLKGKMDTTYLTITSKSSSKGVLIDRLGKVSESP